MRIRTIKTESITNNYINSETGEVIETESEVKHHRIVLTDRDEFIMLFLGEIGYIDHIDKVAVRVLFHSFKYCASNTNVVAMTGPIVKEISQDSGLGIQTIRNAISRLSKKQVFIAMGSATYRINPKYYWKGNTSDRKKTMEYVLRVECKDC